MSAPSKRPRKSPAAKRTRKAARAPAAAISPTPAALQEALDRMEALALGVGMTFERARIAAIMNSTRAVGRLALAWRLAESGLTPQAAEEALLVDKLGSNFQPVDAGAALSH